MTTSGAANWQTIMEKQTPELFKQVTGLREAVMTEGALSLKTKTLMTMLGDALLAHPDGVASIAKRARALGASDAEIAETVGIAFLMGGLPGLVTGANAFRD
ncbi:MAG: carboxymuconolactone decarboxylase family protein [Dehalococcoidales bacterium]|nr:carboxymuconolactone decarboxylase family protein [Dehalococcoidales bacterium]